MQGLCSCAVPSDRQEVAEVLPELDNLLSSCRRVFSPFSWELRRFTAVPADATPAPCTPPASPARQSSSGLAVAEAAGEEVCTQQVMECASPMLR